MSKTLKSLADELNVDSDTLRGLLLAGDETLTPNYYFVDANGAVHAVFPGGVEILANQASFSGDRHVAWRETLPGGPVVAEIAGYENIPALGTTKGLQLATPDIASLGSNNTAGIILDNGGNVPSTASIRLFAEGWQNTLTRGDGFSGYRYQNIANTGLVAGPQFPGAAASVITGNFTFQLGEPARVLATLAGLTQHNGVAGVAYYYWYYLFLDSVLYTFSSGWHNTAGANMPVGGAIVTPQLNAGTHTIGLWGQASASPTWGLYSWIFTAGVLPMSLPDNVHF